MDAPAVDNSEFGAAYAAKQLARRGSFLRRAVRRFYLSNVMKSVDGPAVDVGCGAGQLLERMPPGSLGLEVNPILVHELARMGMNVRLARADLRCIDLTCVEPGRYRTLVLSHVLEHFEAADVVLSKLFADAAALGIERVILVVPGAAGYRSDPTHRTFVNLRFLKEQGLLGGRGFCLRESSYFPGNLEWFGHFFIYHELTLVFDRGLD